MEDIYLLVLHFIIPFEISVLVSTPSADQCLRTDYMHNYLSHSLTTNTIDKYILTRLMSDGHTDAHSIER